MRISRHLPLNQAWLELSLAATDLLAWTQTLLRQGELATAEPKKLRYRLLHATSRITRGSRRLRLRIAATWPWRHELINAFNHLTALPPSVPSRTVRGAQRRRYSCIRRML